MVDYLYAYKGMFIILPVPSASNRSHKRDQIKPTPEVGPIKQQTEAHFKDEPCHGNGSQPGVPSDGPIPCLGDLIEKFV